MDSRTFTFISQGRVPEPISLAVRDAVAAAAGKKLQLTLSPAKKYSSDPQRAYYFDVIVPAWMEILKHGTDAYWSKDETHDYLMEEIGQWFKPIRKGQSRPTRRSYRELTTAEAEEHHAKCRVAAAEEGCDIPEPNEIMV